MEIKTTKKAMFFTALVIFAIAFLFLVLSFFFKILPRSKVMYDYMTVFNNPLPDSSVRTLGCGSGSLFSSDPESKNIGSELGLTEVFCYVFFGFERKSRSDLTVKPDDSDLHPDPPPFPYKRCTIKPPGPDGLPVFFLFLFNFDYRFLWSFVYSTPASNIIFTTFTSCLSLS